MKLKHKEEPKILKYSAPKLNRFSINSVHINSHPIRVTDPTLAKDGEVLKRTNWYTYGEGEKDWLIPEAWLDEIYLVKKGQIWEAEKNIIDNVIKWKKSPTLPIEEIVKQVRDNPCRSVLIMYVPDDFDEETSFVNMSYMYSAEFSINEEDLAVTVDLNFVRYKIDQDINGLKVKIYFDTDSYRFKVGTTSRVNIERALQREFPFNRDPDGIYNATIPDIVFEKLEKIIKDFVVKKYGKDVCSDFKIDSLMSALAVCYFPTEPRLFYICTKMHNLGCANEDVLRDINLNPFSTVKNGTNIFKETFGGVPTTIKKLYLKDPYTIVAYYILTHYFEVRDVGLIREVIDYFPSRGKAKRASITEVNYSDDYGMCQIAIVPQTSFLDTRKLFDCQPVYKLLTETYGCSPKKAFKILFSDTKLPKSDWYDECRALFQNADHFEKDSRAIKTILKYGFCRKSHDVLSAEVQLLGKRILHFDLTDKQKKRYEKDYEIEGVKYFYRLAEGTKRLVEIGETLHICVGSFDYDQRVVDKQCLIVYVVEEKDKNQQYIGCIEIRNESVVHQARTFCNANFTDNLQKSFEKWIKDAKLDFRGNSY